EAEGLAPGVTPVFADPADLVVDIETPTGQTFAIDDPPGPHPRRRPAGCAGVDPRPFGAGNDGLPPGVALLRAVVPAVRRGGRGPGGPAAVPVERLPGLRRSGRLSGGRAGRPVAADRAEGGRPGAGARPAVRDAHARPRHGRVQARSPEAGRPGARRHGGRF